MCFLDYFEQHIFSHHLSVLPRCFHKSVWCGLFTVHRALVKRLNKHMGKMEVVDVKSISLSPMPHKLWNFISIACHGTIVPQKDQSNKSYLDVDCKFAWKKVKMSFPAMTLGFQTQQELHTLHMILGLTNTYGLTVICLTLQDGPKGQCLKSGHHLTTVWALLDDEDYPNNFLHCS